MSARNSAINWLVALAQLIFDVLTFFLLHKIMPRTPTAKNWGFTWNNYPDDWKEILEDALDEYTEQSSNVCSYVLVGKEVGTQEETPHLHGFLTFDKAVTRPAQTFFQAHWEVVRNIEHWITYCKKDGDFWEKGSAPRKRGKQGERTDLEDFIDSVKQSFEDGVHYTPRLARANYPSIAAQYPKFVKEIISDYKPKRVPEPHALRLWQQELNARLNREADARTIEFIVDKVGNTGKTWFSMYYRNLHENVQLIPPGKYADMAYLVEEQTRVFFIDTPREKMEYFQYSFLEHLKDGHVFSSKYVPEHKEWSHNVHVVVLMNDEPAQQVSSDRYKITILD